MCSSDLILLSSVVFFVFFLQATQFLFSVRSDSDGTEYAYYCTQAVLYNIRMDGTDVYSIRCIHLYVPHNDS